MIFKIIYRMACSLYWAHTQILYSFLPSGQPVFIPVVRTTGYSTGIINKKKNPENYLYDKNRENIVHNFISVKFKYNKLNRRSSMIKP